MYMLLTDTWILLIILLLYQMVHLSNNRITLSVIRILSGVHYLVTIMGWSKGSVNCALRVELGSFFNNINHDCRKWIKVKKKKRRVSICNFECPCALLNWNTHTVEVKKTFKTY